MERLLTIAVTGLCAAPLFFWAGMALAAANASQTGGSDKTIANAIGAVLLGIAFAIAGFILTAIVAHRLTPPEHLRYLQIGDAVALIAIIAVWNHATARTPALVYGDARYAVLDIEIRATQSILGGRPVNEVVSIDFDGDATTTTYENHVRRDGEYSILPSQINPIRTRGKEWVVRAFLRDQPHASISFPLGLPPRPEVETDWSGWIAPVSSSLAPEGLTLRHRFRFARYGARDEKSLSEQ